MRVHAFIDIENFSVTYSCFTYRYLKENFKLTYCDIVGNKEAIPKKLREIKDDKHLRTFHTIHGKNSADLWLSMYVAQAVYEEPETDIIVLLSSDRDFIPVVSLALNKQKAIVLITHKSKINAIIDSLKKANLYENDYFTLMAVEDYIVPIFSKEDIDLLPTSIVNYFKASKNIKYVFAKNESTGELMEVPFVEGMPYNVFQTILMSFRLIKKTTNFSEYIKSLFINKKGLYLYLMTETEMLDTFKV